MAADYIYKNADDTVRFRIFKREMDPNEIGGTKDWWDVDYFFKKDGSVKTFSTEAADVLVTKRDAKAEIEREYGPIKSIQPKNTVTDGWKEESLVSKTNYTAKIEQATTFDELKDTFASAFGINKEDTTLEYLSRKISTEDDTNPEKEIERTKERFQETLNDQALYKYAIVKKQTDNGTFSNLKVNGVDLDQLRQEIAALGLRGVFSETAGINTVYMEADEAMKYAKDIAMARVEDDLKREGYETIDDDEATDTKSEGVDSPAFKKWFKNSKVVDENGEPKVVYHGSNEKFDTFDSGKIGGRFGVDRAGFFFTTDRSTARDYAEEDAQGRPVEGGQIVEAHLSLQNPLVIDDAFLRSKGLPAIGDMEYPDSVVVWDTYQDQILNEWLTDNHDGVIIDDKDNDMQTIVALKPEQIKPVDGPVPPPATDTESDAPATEGLQEDIETIRLLDELDSIIIGNQEGRPDYIAYKINEITEDLAAKGVLDRHQGVIDQAKAVLDKEMAALKSSKREFMFDPVDDTTSQPEQKATAMKKPWEMNFTEFLDFSRTGKIHQDTGKDLPGEGKAKTPIKMGEINGYAPEDIAHWYMKKRREHHHGYQEYIMDAIIEGKNVPDKIIEAVFNDDTHKKWKKRRDKEFKKAYKPDTETLMLLDELDSIIIGNQEGRPDYISSKIDDVSEQLEEKGVLQFHKDVIKQAHAVYKKELAEWRKNR